MTTLAFDSLRFARRLGDVGVLEPRAERPGGRDCPYAEKVLGCAGEARSTWESGFL
jgi:hypothetical protein